MIIFLLHTLALSTWRRAAQLSGGSFRCRHRTFSYASRIHRFSRLGRQRICSARCCRRVAADDSAARRTRLEIGRRRGRGFWRGRRMMRAFHSTEHDHCAAVRKFRALQFSLFIDCKNKKQDSILNQWGWQLNSAAFSDRGFVCTQTDAAAAGRARAGKPSQTAEFLRTRTGKLCFHGHGGRQCSRRRSLLRRAIGPMLSWTHTQLERFLAVVLLLREIGPQVSVPPSADAVSDLCRSALRRLLLVSPAVCHCDSPRSLLHLSNEQSCIWHGCL
jgi:hypothetical protein